MHAASTITVILISTSYCMHMHILYMILFQEFVGVVMNVISATMSKDEWGKNKQKTFDKGGFGRQSILRAGAKAPHAITPLNFDDHLSMIVVLP